MDRVFPKLPTSPANPILVSPDGRSALMTYALVDPERHTEGQAYFDRWDLRTGKLVASGPLAGASGMYAAQLVDGGRRLVTLTNSAAATFDSRTFRRLKSVPYRLPRGESPGLVSSMSPDGRTAASPTSQGVDFIDLQTGAVTESVPVSGLIENAAFAPDGRTFVTVGNDRRVLVWRTGKPEPVETLLGHGGRVTGVTVASDGHTAFTSSLDGALFEWDLSGKRRFGRPFSIGPLNPRAAASTAVPALGISPDGRSMAVSPAPGRIEIMSVATSRRLESFDVTHDPQATVKAIAWPEKSQLLVGWATPAPKLFSRGSSHIELWSMAGRPHRLRSFAGAKGTLSVADESPDGRLAAAITTDQVSPTGESASNLVVWDTTSGRVLASIRRKRAARDVTFSRDGTLLASTWDDGLLLLDARTGRRLRWIRHQSGLGVAAFAPDGSLATGSESGIVQLWDPHSGRELSKESQVAPAPVAGISFDPRGDTFVASGASDGVPKLWTTRTLQQLGSDLPGDPGVWLAARYTPDGNKIVVVSPSNRAWVWPATLRAWEQHACTVAGRNLTQEEWRRFVGGRAYSKICS
jgi:WD40 repeat protein